MTPTRFVAAFAALVALAAATSAPAASATAGAPVFETSATAPAKLVVFNRTITTFRAPLLGMSPAARAQHAGARLADLLARPGSLVVDAAVIPQGRAVQIDGALAFVVTTDDRDPLAAQSLDEITQQAMGTLRLVVQETRESRDAHAMGLSTGRLARATLVAALLVGAAARARRGIDAWVTRQAQARAERLRIEGAQLLERERVLRFVERCSRLAFALLMLLVAYVWLGFGLAQFPYTRAWGEQLNGFLLGVAARIARGVADALPDLFVALVIVVLARVAVRVARGFFDRVETGQIRLQRLDPELAAITRRVVVVAIWLFAIAMAYPYIPGSDTEAVKGLSVLVGLMVSLGAAGQVGQALSGLVLAYTRIFRRGEYVRIADCEGTVTELGVFATRIRTGMGEELSVPNALALASVTRNYSRTVSGGYVLDATVTIGYDTPWRQVHALLIEAAQRTPGIAPDPAPRVYQVALTDFYPEYRLVCQALPTDVARRAELLDALHASIQDVFNQYGVQIMSPHYFADPAAPKVVAPQDWHRPPAAAGAHERREPAVATVDP
jgi:small-conductance mechanosensitive channel